jgi:tRNA A58 N-methylase Trm61
MLLSEAERRLGLADKLAAVIADGRDPSRVIHSLSDTLSSTARITTFGVT